MESLLQTLTEPSIPSQYQLPKSGEEWHYDPVSMERWLP